ncbi:MAG: VWA domain-containing protein [Planctomycetes bacterium]|nr:VWA domain-containing protein [Planctomycetota bacterium]
MGFLTPALLAGAALIAVPIVLHLVMRRQPRQLTFPALQFVRNRQEANRRKLNFRHLLLLALRCALIAGFAFALARPTLKGSGLRGKAGAPLAVSLVVDNSLRMQYLHDNQTRQEQATQMAQDLLGKLPEGTEVAVLDLSRSASGFVVDRSTAESRLRNLAPESKPRLLEDAVREAIELVASREDSRQEVFVFTDLNAIVWNETAVASTNEVLAEAPDVRLYLVDVGVAETRNRALGTLELRQQTLRPGEPLHLNVPLEITSPAEVTLAEAPLVELFLVDAQGKDIKRGQQRVEVTEAGSGLVTFELSDLSLGTHQGYVQLPASDPLEVDNRRFFTVEVRPPADVLLLGKDSRDTLFLREALSPSPLNSGTQVDQATVRFRCTTDRFANAAKLALLDYDAVCLLDPPPLSDELWQALADYANQGGGVGLFLGERARASAFNKGFATPLLPGTLKRKSRFETYFRPQRMDHPALAALRPYAESIPWQVFPVFRYWEFGSLAGDTHEVARFANNKPALLVRPVGQGRALTFATSVSDPPNTRGREPWNLLTAPEAAWPFVPLMNQLVGYLAQSDSAPLTYEAGETVSLPLPPNERVSSFVLYRPDGQSLRRTVPPDDDTIRISTTRQLGNYRVSSGGASGQLKRGFSVNVSPDVSHLQRVDSEALLEALPSKQVRLANTLEDVERYVDIGRSGRELFPWLITLVALVWGSEHLLANRFYRETPS